jgi:acyl-CoA synthetase (AMP-forming)/AMP-acid ligase II
MPLCCPQVRGPIVVSQYYKMPQQPAADPASQWFPTGDVASIDGLGYMRISDRSKDVIKSGGEWISSIEIENLAMGHPKVCCAAHLCGVLRCAVLSHTPAAASRPYPLLLLLLCLCCCVYLS